MLKMNTDEIAVPTWKTPAHKITKAFNDGKTHAVNHWYGEEVNPDWPDGVKSWAVNPYSECRPSAFHCWIAGFCEKWAELKRAESA